MTMLYEEGDAIRADKILCEARKISKPKIKSATGRHKIQQLVLWENAFAVIEKKLRFLPHD